MGPSPAIEPDPIWILVSRHFDKPGTDEFIGLQAYEDAPLVSSSSLRPLPSVRNVVSLASCVELILRWHRQATNLSNGTNILVSQSVLARLGDIWSLKTTTLQLMYQPERPQARVKVLLNRQGISQELRFTMSIYSDRPLLVVDGSPGLPFSEKVG